MRTAALQQNQDLVSQNTLSLGTKDSGRTVMLLKQITNSGTWQGSALTLVQEIFNGLPVSRLLSFKSSFLVAERGIILKCKFDCLRTFNGSPETRLQKTLKMRFSLSFSFSAMALYILVSFHILGSFVIHFICLENSLLPFLYDNISIFRLKTTFFFNLPNIYWTPTISTVLESEDINKRNFWILEIHSKVVEGLFVGGDEPLEFNEIPGIVVK